MLRQIEGSRAVAEAVAMSRPEVICAYPITPQTHIVEALSAKVKAGELNAEFLNVESEFAAMSAVIGASATGARAYTATASQGLLFMCEAVYNASGLGLPIVMTVANRAIGAPINIWNDHSDAMSQRDSGWLQLYAESNQEALDLHIQAFLIAEQLSLPVMVWALDLIPEVAAAFSQGFGRDSGGLVRPYLLDDADVVVVALGSVLGTIKDAVDELRADGLRVGVLGITTYRPFPAEAVLDALDSGHKRLVVIERALAPGTGGMVTADVRTALAGRSGSVSTVVAGLGGRAVTKKSLCAMLTDACNETLPPMSFLDLDTGLVERELARMRATRKSGPSAENLLRDLGVTASGIG
jgi:pyruvate ferredoxin oxidoreductase alpha subunit